MNYAEPHFVTKNNNYQKKNLIGHKFSYFARTLILNKILQFLHLQGLCWYIIWWVFDIIIIVENTLWVGLGQRHMPSCCKTQLLPWQVLHHHPKNATLLSHSIANMCRKEANSSLLVEKAGSTEQDHPALSMPEGMRVPNCFNEVPCNQPAKYEPIVWFANPPLKQVI